jgi:hypothetical protein
MVHVVMIPSLRVDCYVAQFCEPGPQSPFSPHAEARAGFPRAKKRGSDSNFRSATEGAITPQKFESDPRFFATGLPHFLVTPPLFVPPGTAMRA